MDWRKIMNSCEEKRPDGGDINYEFVEQYLSELIPDLNLRLLCERDADTDILFPPAQLLWVEGLTLLSYKPGGHRQRPIRDSKAVEVPRHLLERILGWIRNRLTELQGKAHSLRP